MKKPVLPVAMANLPVRLKSAFKVGSVTRPTRKTVAEVRDIIPPPPMRARAVCNNCSLPSPTRRGRCSYCGSSLWVAGLWWPTGFLSMRSLLVAGLLVIGGWGLVAQTKVTQTNVTTSSVDQSTVQAKQSSRSRRQPMTMPHWEIMPALPSMGKSLAAANANLSNALPMVPLVDAPPATPTSTQKPTEAHPQAVPSLPLTCGGFPAAGQPEPDFEPYLAKVQDKIRAHWQPPTVDQPKHVVVLYRIACNGQLVQARVKTSSGIPVADQAALAAVKAAAPFPALPMTYVGRNVDVEFDFDYEMAASRKSHTPLKK